MAAAGNLEMFHGMTTLLSLLTYRYVLGSWGFSSPIPEKDESVQAL